MRLTMTPVRRITEPDWFAEWDRLLEALGYFQPFVSEPALRERQEQAAREADAALRAEAGRVYL